MIKGVDNSELIEDVGSEDKLGIESGSIKRKKEDKTKIIVLYTKKVIKEKEKISLDAKEAT